MAWGTMGALAGDRCRGNASDPLLPRRLRDLELHARRGVLQRLAAVADPRHQGARGRAGRAVVPPRAQQHAPDRAGRDDAPASHPGADRDRRRQGAGQELRQARRCRAEARHDVHHRPAPLRAVPAGLPRAPSQGAADRAGRLATPSSRSGWRRASSMSRSTASPRRSTSASMPAVSTTNAS